jgi:hypothetical protein
VFVVVRNQGTTKKNNDLELDLQKSKQADERDDKATRNKYIDAKEKTDGGNLYS